MRFNVYCDRLQDNSSLLSLRLSGNKIGSRGAVHVARMLHVNSALQEVELADCDLVNTCTRKHVHVDLCWFWSEVSLSFRTPAV